MLVRTDNEGSLAATAKLPGVVDEGVQHMRLFKHDIGHDAQMFALTVDNYYSAAYPPVELHHR